MTHTPEETLTEGDEALVEKLVHNVVVHILGTANWEADLDFMRIELRSILTQKNAEVAEKVKEEREKIIAVMEEHARNRKVYNGTMMSMIDRVKALDLTNEPLTDN